MQEERVALVTGGARRVGAAVVRRLAASGYRTLFTVNRSTSDAWRLKQELQDRGKQSDFLEINLETEDAPEQIQHWVERIAGRLDVLVNNASLYLEDEEPVEPLMRRLMHVNVEVPAALMRRLGPMLINSQGRIVNMTDLLAERPMASYSAYCASKAALVNSTFSAARELAPRVTVNGISPGVVDWPEEMPLEEREWYLSRVPLRRAGTPEDVAALVHYLVTEGSYITGQIIRLDGGRSIV